MHKTPETGGGGPWRMSEGFQSRAFRLTFAFSSATDSLSSYISFPGAFWEEGANFEQIGLSAIPVDASFCWSLAPSMKDRKERGAGRLITMEAIGVPDEADNDDMDQVESSEYKPFVVGTSIVASGIVKVSLVDPEGLGDSKNTVKLCQPSEGSAGVLRVIYNFRPESNVVLIPAIPSILTPADFLAFIRNATGVVDIRLVREASPGQYMALIRLHSVRHASRFAEAFSGRPFSALEPSLCQVLWIAEVEFSTRVQSIVPLFDPADFKDTLQQVPCDDSEAIEVPSCPVCLERLDSSVTGIITTICSHSYHCECMLKWYDGSCPVCRFLLSEEDTEGGSVCVACGCRDNLWICLICGHIGCGRYRSRHAQSHFEECGHTFSLELESHRVWDYVGDNYVHRLVQNQDDGKLVEISHPGSPEPRPQESTAVKKNLGSDEHPDYISSLLVAQLESQRVYYEDKLSALEATWSQQSRAVQTESTLRIDQLQHSLHSLKLNQEDDYLRTAARIQALEARIEELSREKAELQQALAGESAMLEKVMQSQAQLEAALQAKEAEVVELQEQINDLLMHFEGQKAISESAIAGDIRTGTIQLVEAPPTPCKKKPGRRKK